MYWVILLRCWLLWVLHWRLLSAVHLVQRKGGFGRCGNINWAKRTKCNICSTSWPAFNEGGARYITISLWLLWKGQVGSNFSQTLIWMPQWMQVSGNHIEGSKKSISLFCPASQTQREISILVLGVSSCHLSGASRMPICPIECKIHEDILRLLLLHL
jgi:hypothetical protein